MTSSAIRTENLTRDFATVRALDGLSIEVASGKIFGFLGPNGAGKTTTINLPLFLTLALMLATFFNGLGAMLGISLVLAWAGPIQKRALAV